MGTFGTCRTSKEKERNGALLITSGGTVKVRYMGRANPIYMQALADKYKPYMRLINSPGGMPFEQKAQLDKELLVETILTGWEDDVTWPVDENGALIPAAAARKIPDDELNEQPLEFSRENALMVFTELPHMLEEVEFGAKQLETFTDFDMEAAGKNSPTS